MYDGGKIFPGLIVFLVLATSPVWYNAATGQAASGPELEIVTQEEQCIESTDYMRSNHMLLLLEWREQVVRDGQRTYVAFDGRQYDKNLSGTCLDCHSNKAQFCDTCHSYAQAQVNCWDCHVVPEEKK